MIFSPLGPTGVTCFAPPYLFPIPAARITRVFFIFVRVLLSVFKEIICKINQKYLLVALSAMVLNAAFGSSDFARMIIAAIT